jgi:hypothetical protein
MSTIREDLQAEIATLEAKVVVLKEHLATAEATAQTWLQSEEQHVKDIWAHFMAYFHKAP